MRGLLRFDRRDADPADGLFELLLVRMPRSIADLSRILAGLHSRRFDEDAVIFLHTAMPPSFAGRTPHGRSTARTEALTAGAKSATTLERSAFCMILQRMRRRSVRREF